MTSPSSDLTAAERRWAQADCLIAGLAFTLAALAIALAGVALLVGGRSIHPDAFFLQLALAIPLAGIGALFGLAARRRAPPGISRAVPP